MAGRGRGRQSSSLTQDQLNTLGITGKDLPSVPTAPPPTFPPLLSKPAPLEVTNSLNYQILWKEDFTSHMRDSPYFQNTKKTRQSTIDRYSDEYVSILEKEKPDIPWHLMPGELMPSSRKRKIKTSTDVKKYKRIVSIENCLNKLEEKEKTDTGGEDKAPKASDSENENEENEQEMEDEEMDEDNDYGNNYFDNGEAFNDEDDNLDDGPIY